MKKDIQEVFENLKEKALIAGEIVYCTVELRRLYGAISGYSCFTEKCYEPYSEEYLNLYLKNYVKYEDDLQQRISCDFDYYKNRRTEYINTYAEICYENYKYNDTKSKTQFKNSIIKHFYDDAFDIYKYLYDDILASQIEELRTRLDSEYLYADEYEDDDPDIIMHWIRRDGESKLWELFYEDEGSEFIDPSVKDTWSGWDADLGFDVELLEQYISEAFGTEKRDRYSDTNRKTYIRILNDEFTKNNISYSDFVDMCASVYKANSYTTTEVVKIISDTNKVAEIKTEKYVKPSDRKSKGTVPADPIRSLEDIERIKDFFLNNGAEKCRKRNYTVFCLGISTGMRASDLVNLRIKDVFTDDGIVDEIKIHEKKTGRLTHSILNPEMKDILFSYISEFDEINEDAYLFPSQSIYGHLQTKTLYDIFKNAHDKLHLSFHFSTHSLRKTFAYWTIRMHYYDQNIIFSLQDMLNHRDIKNTLYYSGHTKDHLKTLYNDMGKVLNGSVENTPAISSQEQKINQILEMLSKQTQGSSDE